MLQHQEFVRFLGWHPIGWRPELPHRAWARVWRPNDSWKGWSLKEWCLTGWRPIDWLGARVLRPNGSCLA